MELPGGFGARQQSRLLEQGMCAFGLMGAFLLYGILQGTNEPSVCSSLATPRRLAPVASMRACGTATNSTSASPT